MNKKEKKKNSLYGFLRLRWNFLWRVDVIYTPLISNDSILTEPIPMQHLQLEKEGSIKNLFVLV